MCSCRRPESQELACATQASLRVVIVAGAGLCRCRASPAAPLADSTPFQPFRYRGLRLVLDHAASWYHVKVGRAGENGSLAKTTIDDLLQLADTASEVIIQDGAPALVDYNDGQLWWCSADGNMYVDDRHVYSADGLRVGLFKDTSEF